MIFFSARSGSDTPSLQAGFGGGRNAWIGTQMSWLLSEAKSAGEIASVFKPRSSYFALMSGRMSPALTSLFRRSMTATGVSTSS
jgi:hypothetical protein